MTRRNQRLAKLGLWLATGLVALLLGAISDNPGIRQNIAESQPGLYEVEEVSDGDTIIVNMNGTREIIRMIGVDTPETHHPNRPVECYGQEASDFTREFIGDSRVRLQADPLNTNRDRYDRLLRYVYLPDGAMLEEKLIVEGFGFAYTPFPFEKTEQFKALQAQAQQTQKGLWSSCQVSQTNGVFRTNPAKP